MGKTALGGTFDGLHKGHRSLLDKAMEIGEPLVIGLTSDEMIDKPARPFLERKAELEEYLGDYPHEIIELKDSLGPAVSMDDLYYIVVSDETMENGERINQERREGGLDLLKIVVVPMVPAFDGRPISSTRMRMGEIDKEGSKLHMDENI